MERPEKLKLASRCFLCLNRSQYLKTFSKKGKVYCSKCRKSHHHSIYNADQPVPTTVNQIDTQSRDLTQLKTARFWITGPTELKKLTRCLLVSGSQYSFIHISLVDQLQLPVVDKWDVIITPFESTAPLVTHASSCKLPSEEYGIKLLSPSWPLNVHTHTRHTRPFPTM